MGQWRLSTQISQTEVKLGDPVQLKVMLQGKGNLDQARLPTLDAPKALRVFDPEVHDKADLVRGAWVGSRSVEYVLVAQQTGTFTLPGLTLPFFDPETQRWDEARTDPITLEVKPGAQGQQAMSVPGPTATPTTPEAKNQLVGGGLKQLRHTATFRAPQQAPWALPFFLPAVLAPLGLALLLGVGGLVRSSLGQETQASQQKKQAKAARKRLAAAEKLLSKGSTTEFYAEVERALRSFLEARLGVPVAGLTRDQLDALLAEQKVPEAERQRVLAVFETCDLGRYAPGMGEAAARHQTVDDAAAAMEAWS